MKLSELKSENVPEALDAVSQFLYRCPQYSGTELDANVLFERHEREGRPVTAESLEFTFNELQNEGLVGPDYGAENSYSDMLQPVQDEREYQPEDEPETVEYTWIPEEDKPTLADYQSLSKAELRELIKRPDEPSTPKSIDEELASLSTAQLGALIVRAGKR